MYILQVKLQTYNNKHFKKLKKILKFFIKKQILTRKNINYIILPKNKKKIFTVLKSPHVHKKSRESFKYTKYQRTLKISNKYILNLLYINYIIRNFVSKDFLYNSKILKN